MSSKGSESSSLATPEDIEEEIVFESRDSLSSSSQQDSDSTGDDLTPEQVDRVLQSLASARDIVSAVSRSLYERTDTMATQANSVTKLVVNGEEIEVYDSAQPLSALGPQLHDKKARSALAVDKRSELFEKITRSGQFDRFSMPEELGMQQSDLDAIESDFVLDQQVLAFQDTVTKFDTHDVFTLVVPEEVDASGNLTGGVDTAAPAKDALREALKVDYEDVIASDRWRYQFVASEYVKDNYKLTYELLENHLEPELYRDAVQKILSLLPEASDAPLRRSGVLLWVVVMKILIDDSTNVVDAYKERLKSLSIKDYPGQDVARFAKHGKALVNKLESLEMRDSNGNLTRPTMVEDYAEILLLELQNTDDERFNAFFKRQYLKAQEDIMMKKKSKKDVYEDPKVYFDSAITYFKKLAADKKDPWHGMNHVASPSSFKAGTDSGARPGITCFNCGQAGHGVKECKVKLDQDKINEKAKAFRRDQRKEYKKKKAEKEKLKKAAERNASNGKGKWHKPKEGEDNLRVIDGVLHHYNTSLKRWFPKQATVAAAPPPAPAPVTSGEVPAVVPSPHTTFVVPPAPPANAPAAQIAAYNAMKSSIEKAQASYTEAASSGFS